MVKKQPGRIEKARALIANIISPIKNSATSLSNQFLRFGNKSMNPGWTDVKISDQDVYTGYSYEAIRNRLNKISKIANKHIRTQSDVDDLVHRSLDLTDT